MCWGSQHGQPHVHLMLVAPGDTQRLRVTEGLQCGSSSARVTRSTHTMNSVCAPPRARRLSADAKPAPSLHPDTRVFPAGSCDPSLVDKQHPSMAAGWMDPPSSSALPFLRRHRQSQGRAAGKGRLCPFASRVQGWHGSQERQKKWLSPASGVELAIARQFHKNAH